MELIKNFLNTELPVRLDKIKMDTHRRLHVLRDDLLPGGSKQRAVTPLLRDLKRRGVTKVCYASPFAGFAQVALAQACRDVGVECLIFAEFDPTQSEKKLHPFSQFAQSYGATVVITDSLQDAETKSIAAVRNHDYEKIPLGFQCEEFQKHFQHALFGVLAEIHQQLQNKPSRIWLPLGSGTLTRAILKITPPQTKLLCVDVHVLPENDPRISVLREHPQINYFSAEEEFREPCRHTPPLPSNLHYDAKLWSIIQQHGQDGDLWWNVAR